MKQKGLLIICVIVLIIAIIAIAVLLNQKNKPENMDLSNNNVEIENNNNENEEINTEENNVSESNEQEALYDLLKEANISKSESNELMFDPIKLEDNDDYIKDYYNVYLQVEVLDKNYDERGVYEYKYSLYDASDDQLISSSILHKMFGENENKENAPALIHLSRIKDKVSEAEYLIVLASDPYDGYEYVSVYDKNFNSIAVLNSHREYFRPINPSTDEEFDRDLLFFEDEIYFYDLYFSVDENIEVAVQPQTGNIIRVSFENGMEKVDVLKTFTENLRKGEM